MATPEWRISGEYFEACSCDSVSGCSASSPIWSRCDSSWRARAPTPRSLRAGRRARSDGHWRQSRRGSPRPRSARSPADAVPRQARRAESFPAFGGEEDVMLTPNDERLRVTPPEECLPGGVEGDVRPVIVERVKLCRAGERSIEPEVHVPVECVVLATCQPCLTVPAPAQDDAGSACAREVASHPRAHHGGRGQRRERPDRLRNFQDKFARFNEPWRPKVIAEMNDYQFKVVRLQGDFIWHDHKETDVHPGGGRSEDRFSRWRGPCVDRRDVRGAQGRRAQALRRAGGQGTNYLPVPK